MTQDKASAWNWNTNCSRNHCTLVTIICMETLNEDCLHHNTKGLLSVNIPFKGIFTDFSEIDDNRLTRPASMKSLHAFVIFFCIVPLAASSTMLLHLRRLFIAFYHMFYKWLKLVAIQIEILSSVNVYPLALGQFFPNAVASLSNIQKPGMSDCSFPDCLLTFSRVIVSLEREVQYFLAE
uniref:Uncharacterized protein n=1 Tax=Glossina brevipalpis TaxID=37001 RepID=A0A1A9WUL3_9MUSC